MIQKLNIKEQHDLARQAKMKKHAKKTAEIISKQNGVIGIVLSGSTARGPVGPSSDLDMHVIINDKHKEYIPEWTFHDDGIIENVHKIKYTDLKYGSQLTNQIYFAEWLYKTKIGEELNGFTVLWWSNDRRALSNLKKILAKRKEESVYLNLAKIYAKQAKKSLRIASEALDKKNVYESHSQIRLSFQQILICLLIERGWIMRGSKKRFEIAEAYLPDQDIEDLLKMGIDIIGLKDMDKKSAIKITNRRLYFRNEMLVELNELKNKLTSQKLSTSKIIKIIYQQKEHQAQSFDYYKPMIEEGFIHGPINHIRCLSGMIRIPGLFVNCLSEKKEDFPVNLFLESKLINEKFKNSWKEIMGMGTSAQTCNEWIFELTKFISKNDLEKIILPSDYDISRIMMTDTSHKFSLKKRSISQIKVDINSFSFSEFKKDMEDRIKYFNEKDFVGCNSVAERILRIITSPKYRSSALKSIEVENHLQEFVKKLEMNIHNNLPVKFMLPAFPFKIKNPLKSSSGRADLAELASFTKLNEIHLQIQKIYKPGAEFHVFHDGHLYYKHFLHTKNDADLYFSDLKNFIKEMHLEKVIILRDAFLELQNFTNFESIYKKARKSIHNLWVVEKDSNSKILNLRNASKDNINLSDISEESLYAISTESDEKLSKELGKLKKEILIRADLCAYEYMIVQHTLEKINFFNTLVSDGIRMTVHPKKGQVGIYLVKRSTFLLPWMGVGVLKKSGEVSVRYEYDVKHSKQFSPVFINKGTTPFFYKEN